MGLGLGTTATAIVAGASAATTATSQGLYFGRASSSKTMTGFQNHHVLSPGSAPTVTAAAGAGAGATASVAGDDLAHTLTLTTGTSTASGLQATVTFNLAYGAAPKIMLTPKNAASAGLALYCNTATGNWTLCATSALAASTTYLFDVVTVQ